MVKDSEGAVMTRSYYAQHGYPAAHRSVLSARISSAELIAQGETVPLACIIGGLVALLLASAGLAIFLIALL